MAKMDWVTCKLALAGDTAHTLYRGIDNPVSWPEVLVLQTIHGEDAVFDVELFETRDLLSVADEKNRLLSHYGKDAINLVYPGARPMMELQFPGGADARTQTPREPPPQRGSQRTRAGAEV